MVIRELRRQEVTEILEKYTITEDKINEVEQALSMESVNSVKNFARETNISKSQAHRIMRDIIGFKLYIMYCTQHLFDEDMNLRVEMSERLIPILEDQANYGNIFFSDESCFYLFEIVNKHNCRI
ncbi:unnamed protein product [Rotaria sp. Silwood2]|nr:unnamed protein product [Rotaria sp. Silwood2]